MNKKELVAFVKQAAKSIRNWKTALNRFMIEFEDRLKDVI